MYQVRFYKGNYSWRQKQANQDKCVAYVEHHFNSSGSQRSDYSVVITGYNASETSKNWGKSYAQRISSEFNVPLGGRSGLLIGGFNGRGNGNLKYTHMPAILLEPLFASNPTQADWIRSAEGQDKLAKILADSIIEFFPDGSLIGFSIGHKYKTSRPSDRGAPLHGGGMEADYAEIVMEKTQSILEKYSPSAEPPTPATPIMSLNDIRVIRDGKELWAHTDIDEDDEVFWDPENRVLYISGQGSA
jgi:hypothetical protein